MVRLTLKWGQCGLPLRGAGLDSPGLVVLGEVLQRQWVETGGTLRMAAPRAVCHLQLWVFESCDHSDGGHELAPCSSSQWLVVKHGGRANRV